MEPKATMSFSHILLAVWISAMWGGSYLMIKIGLGSFPPFLFASLRFLLVAFPLVFFVPRPAAWSMIVGAGLGFTLQFSCLFVGLKWGMPAGLTSLIFQTQVLFTALMAPFFFQERLRFLQWAGIFVAGLGIFLMALQQNHPDQKIGFFVLLLGALGWTCANIFIKKSGAKNAFHLMIWISLIPPLPLLGFSYIFERQMWSEVVGNVQLRGVLALGYVAYLATLAGYGIWGILMRTYPASLVASFSMLVPVFGLGFAWLWSGEALGWSALGSSVLIFSGVCLVIFRWPSSKKRRPLNA